MYLDLLSEGYDDIKFIGVNGYQYIDDNFHCMICDDPSSCGNCDDIRVLPWVQDVPLLLNEDTGQDECEASGYTWQLGEQIIHSELNQIECEENEHPFLIRLDCGSIGCNEEDFILGYIFSNNNDTNYVREDEYIILTRKSWDPDPVKYYGYYCANSDSVNYELWVGDNYLSYIQFYQIDKNNNGKYIPHYSLEGNTDSEQILSITSPGNESQVTGTLYFTE